MGVEKNGIYFNVTNLSWFPKGGQMEVRFTGYNEKGGEVNNKCFGMWFNDNPDLKRPPIPLSKGLQDAILTEVYEALKNFELEYKTISNEHFEQFNKSNSQLVAGAFDDVLETNNGDVK